jgi:hypothetical protein
VRRSKGLLATTARGNTSRRRADDAATPRLKYRAPEPPPLVSLFIPSRGRAEILEKCIRPILTLTRYRPYEIIIVAREPATRRCSSAAYRGHGAHSAPAGEMRTRNSSFPPAKPAIMVERIDTALMHIRILFEVPVAIEELRALDHLRIDPANSRAALPNGAVEKAANA